MSESMEKWVCSWNPPLNRSQVAKVRVLEGKNRYELIGSPTFLLDMRRYIKKSENLLHDTAEAAIEAYERRLNREINELKTSIAKLERRKAEAHRLRLDQLAKT